MIALYQTTNNSYVRYWIRIVRFYYLPSVQSKAATSLLRFLIRSSGNVIGRARRQWLASPIWVLARELLLFLAAKALITAFKTYYIVIHEGHTTLPSATRLL